MVSKFDYSNINYNFIEQYMDNGYDCNLIKIIEIVDNTIKLLKDDNKFLESLSPDVVEDKAAVLSSILLFLSEIKNIISPNINYEELVHKYMIECKKFIEQNINYLPISLYSGLVDFGLAIYAVNKMTGNYNKILNTINNLIVERVMYKLAQIELDSQNIRMGDFDVMMGLSGVTNYLFIYHNNENIKQIIERILIYFINLTKKIKYQVMYYQTIILKIRINLPIMINNYTKMVV